MKKLLCSLFVIASCNSFASVGDINAQVNGSVGASLYDFYSSVRSNIDTELHTSNDSVTMVGFTNNSGYLMGNNLSNANALFITFKDSSSSQILWTKTFENEFFDKPQVSFARTNSGYSGAYLTPSAIKSINYSKAYKTVSADALSSKKN